jgi:hypothetical protein
LQEAERGMKRSYKFLIGLAVIWVMGIFPIWILIPDPHIASRNMEGFAAGLLLVAIILGWLIWALWPGKYSK